VGSAVNDTTRELGGTLGVAVVGSVFASFYGAALVDGLSTAGLPDEVVATAEQSMAAALAVASQAPAAIAADVIASAQEAFIAGLSAGSLVAAGIAAAGAIGAALYLPARQSRIRQEPVPTGGSDADTEASTGRSSSPVSA
jgi:hypothetical protein